MSTITNSLSHAAMERLREQTRLRTKQLRRVSRHLSNAPINESGSELERVRRRRAQLVARMNDLATGFDRESASGLWTSGGPAVEALDSVLTGALTLFERGDRDAAVKHVVGATALLDELLGNPEQVELRSTALVDLPTAMPAGLPGFRPREGYRSMDISLERATENAGEQGQPVMRGNFAVFDEWTEIVDIWEGNFMESIQRGAFERTFKDDRDQMRVLFQHGRDAMLGSKVLGSIDDLKETKTGAAYRVPLFRGLPELLLEGLAHDQYGASFRFESVQEMWTDKPKPSEYNPRGIPERVLTELRVAEFGPVTFPAYSSATAGLRSRSLSSRFINLGGLAAGRPSTGSAGGGAGEGTSDDRAAPSDLQARDRAWQLRRPAPKGIELQ